MAKPDYYETLGVARDVAGDELKKAYRTLAMKYHPDRNPDDAAAEAKFKELSEAYGVLSDPQKREAYNQYGHAAFEGGADSRRGSCRQWSAGQTSGRAIGEAVPTSWALG